MNNPNFWQGTPVAVRHSARARRVWLKIRPGRGIEVVLPYRISKTEVPDILRRHQTWIQTRLDELIALGQGPGQDLLPRTIDLPLVGQKFTVAQHSGERTQLVVQGSIINLALSAAGQEEGVLLLQHWLLATAKNVLVPLCSDLADQQKMPLAGVSVRNQSSRWGSCSAQRRISLNAKLLFVRHELARHVILHELCHFAHRNHGPDFWTSLRRLDPLLNEHEMELRHAWDALPLWAKWRP